MIRERARAARQGISPERRDALSRAACARVIAMWEVFSARTVLGYAATQSELDPTRALLSFAERGARIALPRVNGPRTLSLHEVTAGHLDGDDELESSSFGIPEPAVSLREVRPDEVDLVIVPGVAFDAQGHRLGYGGGYYDRLLAKMPHARFIGVCFDGQVVQEVPAEEHDIVLHAVVTPSRTLRPRL